ncbi:MAG: pirin family protein [Labilithrix sp.]|nr:pirin family protein [Labilithrix sp.]MBX3224850.1 pirin family protein [Labilithrix sp.]
MDRLSRRQAIAGAAGLGLAACRTEAPSSAEPKREPSSEPSLATGKARLVERIIDAQPTRDGAGVKLSRALGGRALSMLDPFLLLDEFHSDDPNDYAAGFPSHPHRGFETVTYMLEGAMEHKDSVGNSGRLRPGSAQWMTAGHGIVHSEMPKQERGLMWGFQLWVNLPRARKMIKPRYQDIAPDRIPELDRDGARVRVVAGSALGATGPITGIDVDPLFLDVTVTKGVRFEVPMPSEHAAFAFVTEGAVRLGPSGAEVRAGQLAVLGRGDRALATCDAASGRMVLIAGRPIGEPVARGGPFVMNTQDEIREAWDDYRAGRLLGGV